MKWQLLHKACWAGDRETVERLLKAGADPNLQAPTGWRQTPLGRTLEFRVTHPKHPGHVEVVRLLLHYGADETVRSTSLDMTPYELASFCGLEPVADLLRNSRWAAPPHPSGMTGVWALAASRLPEPYVLAEATRLVPLENVNQSWRKATPLMMAAGHAGHFQVAGLLLQAGADPNAGTSILHAGCEWHFEHLVPALDYRARHGWDVNARDPEGQTALHKAAFLGYASAIRTLLAHGANPVPRDSTGTTPMDLARKGNKLAAVKALSRA